MPARCTGTPSRVRAPARRAALPACASAWLPTTISGRSARASAFAARRIVAHANTAGLIQERGVEDWASEQGRMPRLFAGAETIPGLTRPTDTFEQHMTIDLGNRTVELRYLGRGHTSGDLVVWLPDDRILFAGDLVEAQAAPYMGDGHIGDWSTTTLDNVKGLGAQHLVGGRGDVVHGEAVEKAIEDTRAFLRTTLDGTRQTRDAGGSLKDAYEQCISKQPGFISAALHVNDARTRIANYSKWRRREDFQATLRTAEMRERNRGIGALCSRCEPVMYEVSAVF